MKLHTTHKSLANNEHVIEKPTPPRDELDDGVGTAKVENPDVVQSNRPTQEFPHSVFPEYMITYLTYLLGYLSLASSLTATIYFPIIDLLAERYHTSVQAINLTITLYVVLQGIAPSFFSPLSDTLGRRPVFLITFAVYLLAGVGLVANTDSYVALILLRGLQSVGGSAVLSLAYAVVADVVPHSRRGSVLGPMLAATNLGPCIGPVIGGGAILVSGNPRWCFATLVIFGASALLLIGWTMPETGRSVVGNGAVEAQGVWATWWQLVRSAVRRRNSSEQDLSSGATEKALKEARGNGSINHGPTPAKDAESTAPILAADDPNVGKTGRGKLSAPNPLPSVRLIFHRDTALILWLCATPYAVWYCIQTSIPLIYGPGYGFNDLEVGLSFLAGGGGVIAGGVAAGRLMDWSFRKTATEAGFSADRKRGIDIDCFPIEKARSTASIPIMLVSMFAVGGYGWAVHARAHPAIPLVLQFYIGAKCTVLHQTYSALIVDIFPSNPGRAGASNNICRCALSAVLVAILQPVVKAIGYAWLFTILALIEGLSGVAAVWTLRRRGWEWRNKRNGQGSRCSKARGQISSAFVASRGDNTHLSRLEDDCWSRDRTRESTGLDGLSMPTKDDT
ncbi:major facilitator superfamily domain-containing protein [Nemania serpens]|nr:major facilitator superfamily domain-containing protein [Nemania serpens]